MNFRNWQKYTNTYINTHPNSKLNKLNWQEMRLFK